MNPLGFSSTRAFHCFGNANNTTTALSPDILYATIQPFFSRPDQSVLPDLVEDINAPVSGGTYCHSTADTAATIAQSVPIVGTTHTHTILNARRIRCLLKRNQILDQFPSYIANVITPCHTGLPPLRRPLARTYLRTNLASGDEQQPNQLKQDPEFSGSPCNNDFDIISSDRQTGIEQVESKFLQALNK